MSDDNNDNNETISVDVEALTQEAETPELAIHPPPTAGIHSVLSGRVSGRVSGDHDTNDVEKIELPLRPPSTPVSNASLGCTLHPLMSREECDAVIAWGEEVGIEEEPTKRKDVRSNTRLMFVSEQLAEDLFARVLPHLEEEVTVYADDEKNDGSLGRGRVVGQDGVWVPIGLNPLFRLCRYVPGNHFAPHYDSQYAKSESCVSFKTCMIYLNELGGQDDAGGATQFLDDSLGLSKDPERGIFCAPPEAVYLSLPPLAGRAIVFNHRVMHEGQVLEPHARPKYILRTDVMFERVEGSQAPVSPRSARARDAFARAGIAEAGGDMAEATRLYAIAFKLDPSLGTW